MSATSNLPLAGRPSIPALAFDVLGAEASDQAAVPTLLFELRIRAAGSIRSILLDVQIQIAARRRGYSEAAQDRLLELFGTPERWSTTLRTLPWLRTTVVVPAFEEEVTTEVTVPCTYDFEVIAARYLAALEDGDVPLEFLFSGSMFYAGPEDRLQVVRIALDQEVAWALPVATWRRAMNRHFPGSAWLRVSETTLAQLAAYKARHAFVSWDAAFDALLREEAGA